MTVDERLERLTGVVETLASSVVAHDNQIEALLKFCEESRRDMIALSSRWEAYLNTLRPQ